MWPDPIVLLVMASPAILIGVGLWPSVSAWLFRRIFGFGEGGPPPRNPLSRNTPDRGK
jgi:hypothetical protein